MDTAAITKAAKVVEKAENKLAKISAARTKAVEKAVEKAEKTVNKKIEEATTAVTSARAAFNTLVASK